MRSHGLGDPVPDRDDSFFFGDETTTDVHARKAPEECLFFLAREAVDFGGLDEIRASIEVAAPFFGVACRCQSIGLTQVDNRTYSLTFPAHIKSHMTQLPVSSCPPIQVVRDGSPPGTMIETPTATFHSASAPFAALIVPESSIADVVPTWPFAGTSRRNVGDCRTYPARLLSPTYLPGRTQRRYSPTGKSHSNSSATG